MQEMSLTFKDVYLYHRMIHNTARQGDELEIQGQNASLSNDLTDTVFGVLLICSES